jgi:hypothetical protein
VQELKGGTWIDVRIPRRWKVGSQLYGVSAISDSNVWAVGSAVNGGLVLHWDGIAWDRLASPEQQTAELFSVSGASAGNVILSGEYQPNSRILPLIARWDGNQWVKSFPN